MPNELFPPVNRTDRRFTDRPKVKIILLSILFAFSLFLGLATYASAKLRQPFNDDAPTKVIEIGKGSTSRSIAWLLEQEKIISNDRIFLYYLIIKRAANKIQAGKYELSGAMTIPEVVETLTQGKVISNEVRIRIGEGWTIKQIADAVEHSGLATRAQIEALIGTTPDRKSLQASSTWRSRYDFLQNLPANATLEGYLFPDTYNVSREGGAEELIAKMLRNFDRQLTPELRSKAAAQNHTLRQVLIIASLVEAEVGRNISGRSLTDEEKQEIEEERRIVADIFWTRLGLGMGLESDATIGYITGTPRAQALLSDLKINSPYNTYRFVGLPPGPIGNPSLASIEATLNPADTPYLFFLSAPDGKAYFARTLQEHNENRRKYLD